MNTYYKIHKLLGRKVGPPGSAAQVLVSSSGLLCPHLGGRGHNGKAGHLILKFQSLVSQRQLFLAEWPFPSHLSSLRLHHLICRMRVSMSQRAGVRRGEILDGNVSSHKMLHLLHLGGDKVLLLLLLFSLRSPVSSPHQVSSLPGLSFLGIRDESMCAVPCQGGSGMKVRWGDLSYITPFLLTSVGDWVPCCAWHGGALPLFHLWNVQNWRLRFCVYFSESPTVSCQYMALRICSGKTC